ncbi:MAG: DUF262 domain-containing protein, partial [Sulfurovum sp.]
MGLSISAEQKTIIKIFKIEEQYIIPAYQRPYSWEYDECFTLYNDIMEAFHDESEDYFIGNIVIAKSNTIKDKLEVIDGQQRLTTLLLLIKVLSIFSPEHKALKDCLEIEDWESDETFPRIESEIFESDDKKSLEEVILFTQENLEELLRKCSKNGKFIEKKCANRFVKNIMFFYNWIKFYSEKHDLKDFIRYLLTQVYLLPIELGGRTPEEARDKALKIFETLNNRGKELSNADIFKAKLYDKANKINEAKTFIDGWTNLKSSCDLQGVKLDDVFRYYSHVIRGENQKTSSEINLRYFFTRLDYSPFNHKNYKEILADLFNIVEVIEFINEEKQKSSKLAKWLQLIELYTNQYPKMLVVVYLFRQGYDEKKLEIFLKKVVRYAYYKGSTTTIKFEIYNMIRDISLGKEIDEYIQENIKLEEFDYLGRLKNGYALLSFYAREDNSIGNYSIDRLITYLDKNLSKKGWSREDIKKTSNSLGNFIILDEILKGTN